MSANSVGMETTIAFVSVGFLMGSAIVHKAIALAVLFLSFLLLRSSHTIQDVIINSAGLFLLCDIDKYMAVTIPQDAAFFRMLQKLWLKLISAVVSELRGFVQQTSATRLHEQACNLNGVLHGA